MCKELPKHLIKTQSFLNYEQDNEFLLGTVAILNIQHINIILLLQLCVIQQNFS